MWKLSDCLKEMLNKSKEDFVSDMVLCTEYLCQRARKM